MRAITIIGLFAVLSQVHAFDPSMLVNSPAVRPPPIVRPAPASYNPAMIMPSLRSAAMQQAPTLQYVGDNAVSSSFAELVKRPSNYNDAKMGVGGTKPTTDGSQNPIGGKSPYTVSYPAIGERPTGLADESKNNILNRPKNAYKPGPSYALTGNEKYEQFKNNLAPVVKEASDQDNAKIGNKGAGVRLAAEPSSDVTSAAAAGIISFFVGSAITLAIFYRRTAPKVSEYQLLAA